VLVSCLVYYSTLKMEKMYSSATLVDFHEPSLCYISENRILEKYFIDKRPHYWICNLRVGMWRNKICKILLIFVIREFKIFQHLTEHCWPNHETNFFWLRQLKLYRENKIRRGENYAWWIPLIRKRTGSIGNGT
jgi:hypothetical protein